MFVGAFQFAYVAHDVDRAAQVFAARFGIPEFHIHDVTVECSDSPGTCHIKVAIAWLGNRQIELIEPIDGAVDLYTRALPPECDAIVFHHIGIRISGGLDAWPRTRAALLSRGARIALEGGFGDTLRFAYLDTTARLGHYLEYIWLGAPFLSVSEETA
jgi:hypothetical protein